MTGNLNSDPMEILSQVLKEMKEEQGKSFILRQVNLSELQRRTGISRKRLRNLRKNDFKERARPSRKGKKNKATVLSGFTGIIDDYLRKDVANSEVIYDRLQEMGYQGGKTQVKVYIAAHKNLLPAKRQIVSPQGNRGRRYSTGPGESYQMDWGFMNVEYDNSIEAKVSCFAKICHLCLPHHGVPVLYRTARGHCKRNAASVVSSPRESQFRRNW